MMKNLREQYLETQAKIEQMANRNSMTFIGDSATAQNDEGFGYLYNALEFIDSKLHEPMYKFFWYQVLPFKYVGGALELASFYKTNYSVSEINPIASGSNNIITTVKAQLEKFSNRVMATSYILELGLIDQMKADKIGFDVMAQFEKGIYLRYNKYLDVVTHTGLPGVTDSYGLTNNPDVATTSASTAWASQDAVSLFDAINTIIIARIIACEYDEKFVPNRILVPLTLFSKLAQPMAIVGTNDATATTGVSLLEYLKKNLASNYAGYDGGVDIFPNRYLASAGTNSSGRMVIYRYDEDLVRGIIGMELTRGATVFDTNSQSTKTTYTAFIGEPQFIYTAPIAYYDNAA